MAEVEPIIRFDNVYKSFDNNLVHRGVSLSIQDGQIITLLGPSGTGKSVLLKELIGLIKPDEGAIYVEGRDIVPLKEKDLLPIRRNIGMLFQGAALFDSLSVAENIAFPLREHLQLEEDQIAERVERMLELVGMPGVQNLMPEELSGGMKKRVGLARALAVEPKIMLYDEPTTGLDPITARRICRLIVDLRNRLDMTCVIVTHDIENARLVSQHVAMLHEGKIIATGTWEELEKSDISLVKSFLTEGIE